MKNAGFDFNVLRALEVFCAVVELRHLTQAAEALGMTQSAVSQQIKTLETALGTTLLDRSIRPIALTRSGIALHRRATALLADTEQLRVEMRRIDSAPVPVLRVAMLASIATTLAPQIVSLARERFAIPEVSLSAGLTPDHQEALRSRSADVAITADSFFEMEGLQRHSVLTEQFLLVLPEAYEGRAEDLAEIGRSLPLSRFARHTPVGRRTDQHLRRVRLELPRLLEGDRASVVMAPVADGRAFAILTPTLLIDGLVEGMAVTVRPLPIAGFGREITLVAREGELEDLPGVMAAEAAERLSTRLAHLPLRLPADSYRPTLDQFS